MGNMEALRLRLVKVPVRAMPATKADWTLGIIILTDVVVIVDTLEIGWVYDIGG